ncbi:hypothetical protein ON010_g11153 [Phytophthora cinnamomi]|nr:hypothetical protein ON010_g11153 [Phytophthora cinnamomi]
MSDTTNPIKFGKHKHKTVLQLFDEDPKYILWLIKQQWLSTNLLTEIKQRFLTLKVPFGRHEGKTLRQIRNEDEDYYDWLVRETRINEKIHPQSSLEVATSQEAGLME